MRVKPGALLLTAMLLPAVPLARHVRAATPEPPQSLTLSIPNGGPPADAGPACPPVADYVAPRAPLEHVRAALTPGGRLDVLAVGSGTVLGPEAGHPDDSFAFRMAQAIKAAAPQTDIELTVRGGRGLTAKDMLALIEAALDGHAYQLVLWQTGTVEAVRGLPAEALYQALQAGAERVRQARGDLVLIDPQFSRFLRANANLPPYEAALVRAGELPGVNLFHRFDLMHAWMEAGDIDLERAPRAEREKTTEALHACLGRALARMVLQWAGQ